MLNPLKSAVWSVIIMTTANKQTKGNNMVHITNLKKQYKTFPVLRGLNMNIEKGDVYGFIGRNGCGKSTTMNIICNIIPKDDGEIYIGNGAPVKIGYLPESPMLYGYMNAVEYLEYIAACCKYEGDISARVNEVLDIVGLQQAKTRRVKGYSRGMNQRLGIGAAILNKPELLLLDEPTSALDPQGRIEVINIIENLKSIGSTIILSTHILSDVERVANKIGIMNNGVIMQEGNLRDIMEESRINSVCVNLFTLNDEIKAKLMAVDFARVEFYEASGMFRFFSDNSEDCSAKLMKYMCDNGIIAEKLSVEKSSLEEIFMKVVGTNAN